MSNEKNKTSIKEYLAAFGRYLQTPKGKWDLLDYGGFLLAFLLFCLLVIWGGYQLELI